MAILFRLELLIKNMKATTEKPSTPSGDGKTFSKDLRVLFTSSLRMLKMLTPTVQISNQMLSSGGILQISYQTLSSGGTLQISYHTQSSGGILQISYQAQSSGGILQISYQTLSSGGTLQKSCP